MKVLEANTPPRYSPNPIQVSKDSSFYLSIGTAREGLQLLKWLLTQFHRRGRLYSEKELIVLWLLSEYFNSYRNKGWWKANELEFLKLKSLAQLSLCSGRMKDYQKYQEKILINQNILFSPRAFLGLPFNYLDRFLKVLNRKKRRRLKDLRRIGVGYRDKGTASKPSIDGSPRWSEVAVSEKIRKEESLHFGNFREWWETSTFFVNPKSL